jgi:hypothetical protein
MGFTVSAEPRLLNVALAGPPQLDKALDEKGQRLAPAPAASGSDAKTVYFSRSEDLGQIDLGWFSNRRVTNLRLKEPTGAKQLKEISGKLLLQVDVQNEVLARLDKVMDSAGKSADGAGGGTLKLQSIKKQANGNIEAQVTLVNLGPNPLGNNIIINQGGGIVIQGNIQIQGGGGIVIGPNGVRINGAGNGNLKDLPDLLDAKGQKFRPIGLTNDSFNFVNGTASRSGTITYQPTQGQAEPSELVLFGTRTHTIGVPFRFENVSLP